jgi:hypothetical protein
MISKVLRDFPFSRKQPLISADDQYIRMLKNKLIKLKKQEDRTLWLSHGTCSYIRMYTNAVANSVMLCLQRDFYNTIFNIKHKLHVSSGSATPPPSPTKILGAYCGAEPCSIELCNTSDAQRDRQCVGVYPAQPGSTDQGTQVLNIAQFMNGCSRHHVSASPVLALFVSGH